MTARYAETLREGAASLGLSVSDPLVGGVARHHELVLQWARRMNLTTVTDPVVAARRHGLDCLLFAEMFPEDAHASVLDVGSGAGFPGIIMALARPHLQLVLLEPIRKRCSFLRVARAELGLSNVRIIEGRLDEGRLPSGLESPVNAVVSRATIPPLELVPRISPVLESKGILIVSGGAGAPSVDALKAAGLGVGLQHRERRDFILPGQERRVLDRFQKVD